jgi:hypothetical protein
MNHGGSLDCAPRYLTLPNSEDAAEDEEFGDLTAFTNDDDEFGEFASAVTFSLAHTPTGKLKIVNETAY